MKAIENHLQKNKPDRVDKFKAAAQGYIKKVMVNFKDYDFVCTPDPLVFNMK
jgi:Translationally controlled tumour protein